MKTSSRLDIAVVAHCENKALEKFEGDVVDTMIDLNVDRNEAIFIMVGKAGVDIGTFFYNTGIELNLARQFADEVTEDLMS